MKLLVASNNEQSVKLQKAYFLLYIYIYIYIYIHGAVEGDMKAKNSIEKRMEPE